MPVEIKQALSRQGLMTAYRLRPAYQQNDYIGWITQARRADTRAKRLRQMLKELKRGGVYMGMKHTPSARS
jgi:uncharacterized protein YdeI (YjbR/CyaY-like superfamily)